MKTTKKIDLVPERPIEISEFPTTVVINTNTDVIVQVCGYGVLLQRNSIYELTIQELKGD